MAKRPFVPREIDTTTIGVMKAIKHTLDPTTSSIREAIPTGGSSSCGRHARLSHFLHDLADSLHGHTLYHHHGRRRMASLPQILAVPYSFPLRWTGHFPDLASREIRTQFAEFIGCALVHVLEQKMGLAALVIA